MIPSNPHISIIMATFNRAHFILEALDSVRRQSYRNWECLIIDDGSTDDTQQVLEPVLKVDNRIKYFRRPTLHRKGLPGCRNYGLEMAVGSYIVFFDDDDIAHPQLLEISMDQIKSSEVDYCHYNRKTFTGDFQVKFEYEKEYEVRQLNLQHLPSIIMGQIPFNSCQVLWRKKCFLDNMFNENLMYAEEWECYSRILSTGVKGISIEKALYFGRKHPHSNTGEFWQGKEIRKLSQVKAVKLVIENLKQKKLLSKKLIRYFVQMGIFLKEKSVVDYVLQISDAGLFTRYKYRMLYKFYPITVIGYRTKKLLKQKLS